MSTRLGMADGRCIQDFTPSRILHEELMSRAGINVYDNYSFRQMAQKAGPDGMGLPLKNAACRTGQVVVLNDRE